MICDCYKKHGNKSVCYGTKEMEECSCDGMTRMCNFYPEKRLAPMTDSEEIAELISQIQYMGGLESRVAEHLIANGVTIQKHGLWFEFNSFMSCSECDTDWYYGDNDCDRFDYCPNCGAKMDAERKNDGR